MDGSDQQQHAVKVFSKEKSLFGIHMFEFGQKNLETNERNNNLCIY